MFSSIVIPLDGSAFARQALPVAMALAIRSDADVALVHADEPPALGQGAPMFDTRLYYDQQNETRTELIALAAQLSRDASLRVQTQFLDGAPGPALQQYLARARHDLVVMMTHGRSGMSRALLGNVADHLVGNAVVPLLLMRDEAVQVHDPVEPLFRRVLLPLDGSALAEDVLARAAALGTPDLTVYALLAVVTPSHALDYPDFGSVSEPMNDGAQYEAAHTYLNGIARELRDSGVLVEVCVENHGHPAHAILDVASRRQADLIALCTHGRGAASRTIHGSVVDKVVRGATVPTLVFRPEGVGTASTQHEHGHETPRHGARAPSAKPVTPTTPRAAA